MKKHLFILIFALPIFIGQSVSGQGYRPFPKENAFWTINGGGESEYGNYYLSKIFTINGDSLYQGKTYNKVYIHYKHNITGDTLIKLHSLIREDTLQRKVWFVRLHFNEYEEKLGYDFSANIGDTVVLPALDFYDSGPNNSIILKGDSVFELAHISNIHLLNGEYSRHYSFKSINSISLYGIIEGIGGILFAFPHPKYGPLSSPYIQILECLKINDSIVYQQGVECGFFSHSVNESNLLDVEVFPNPCSGQLHLSFQNRNNEELSLELISHLGKVVYSDKISNIDSYSIKTSNLANGLYLLRLSGKQQTQTFKIIVAH